MFFNICYYGTIISPLVAAMMLSLTGNFEPEMQRDAVCHAICRTYVGAIRRSHAPAVGSTVSSTATTIEPLAAQDDDNDDIASSSVVLDSWIPGGA